MNSFLCIIVSIVVYIILMLIGTNLLGMIVRGINKPSYLRETMDYILSIIFLIISIGYLYALYYFWNFGLLAAGLILILVRLPDLLYEMKTGEKMNQSNMAKGPVAIWLNILAWLVLPLVWYSLCQIAH